MQYIMDYSKYSFEKPCYKNNHFLNFPVFVMIDVNNNFFNKSMNSNILDDFHRLYKYTK